MIHTFIVTVETDDAHPFVQNAGDVAAEILGALEYDARETGIIMVKVKAAEGALRQEWHRPERKVNR